MAAAQKGASKAPKKDGEAVTETGGQSVKVRSTLENRSSRLRMTPLMEDIQRLAYARILLAEALDSVDERLREARHLAATKEGQGMRHIAWASGFPNNTPQLYNELRSFFGVDTRVLRTFPFKEIPESKIPARLKQLPDLSTLRQLLDDPHWMPEIPES